MSAFPLWQLPLTAPSEGSGVNREESGRMCSPAWRWPSDLAQPRGASPRSVLAPRKLARLSIPIPAWPARSVSPFLLEYLLAQKTACPRPCCHVCQRKQERITPSVSPPLLPSVPTVCFSPGVPSPCNSAITFLLCS